MEPLDPSTLTDRVQSVVGTRPGVCLFTVPDTATQGATAHWPERIYVSASVATGDPAELSAVLAHELAHLDQIDRRRNRRLRWLLVVAAVAAAEVLPGWGFAVLLGAMPATLAMPDTPPAFAPALAAIAAGFLLTDALTSPLYLRRARREEAKCDRLAFSLGGETEAFIRWITRHTSETVPTQPWFYASHPAPADRIRMAEHAAALTTPDPRPAQHTPTEASQTHRADA
jgi:Zn-dependent protease with chaperone function